MGGSSYVCMSLCSYFLSNPGQPGTLVCTTTPCCARLIMSGLDAIPGGRGPGPLLPEAVEAVGRLRVQAHAEVVPEQALHLHTGWKLPLSMVAWNSVRSGPGLSNLKSSNYQVSPEHPILLYPVEQATPGTPGLQRCSGSHCGHLHVRENRRHMPWSRCRARAPARRCARRARASAAAARRCGRAARSARWPRCPAAAARRPRFASALCRLLGASAWGATGTLNEVPGMRFWLALGRGLLKAPLAPGEARGVCVASFNYASAQLEA